MKPTSPTSTEDINKFFTNLYGQEPPGYLAIWTKKPNETRWVAGKNFPQISGLAENLGKSRDVYFGLGLQANDLGKNYRGKSDRVIAIPGVWADIDIADVAHKATNLPPSLKEAQDWLSEVAPPPTVLINSGHGLHVYWLFTELWVFQNADEQQKAQALLKAFQARLIYLAKQNEWKMDNTAGLAWVLRVPGTMNYKREPVSVTIIKHEYSRRYRVTDLEESVKDFIGSQLKTEAKPSKLNNKDENEWPPADPGPILKGCAWVRHCKEDAPTLPEPEWYAMLSIVGRCEKGDILAHEWSASYPGYSKDETEVKLQQALAQGGPRTCQNIQAMTGGTYCQACAYSGAVTSPIVLGHSFAQSGWNKALIDHPIEELNKDHAIIMHGGKCRILNEAIDPNSGYKIITFSSERDFILRYAPYQKWAVKEEKAHEVPISKLWLYSAKRREYKGIVFNPQKETPGFYNLWQGFAVKPKEGDCGLFLKHIRKNIARGNQEHADYIIRWMAHVVQHPDQRVGVALVFQGKQGTGKSLLCKVFGSLFGPHYMMVNSGRQLVGNFNAHLRDVVVLFADEAFWAGDKASEGALKAMITEDYLSIEAKGQDINVVPNHLNLLMASNHEWVVPAGPEERRFCTFDVGADHMQDTAYFKALVDQMDHGGREALLYYLMHLDLSGVNLRKFPQTEALMEQKLKTLNDVQRFWWDRLEKGSLTGTRLNWNKGSISKHDLFEEYIQFAQKVGQTRRSAETELGMGLKKLVPGLRDGKKLENDKWVTSWVFPSLQQCRKFFNDKMHSAFPWGEEEPETQGAFEDEEHLPF